MEWGIRLSILKILFISAVLLFCGIGFAAFLKKDPSKNKAVAELASQSGSSEKRFAPKPPVIEDRVLKEKLEVKSVSESDFPNIDRVFQLFTTGSSKLPIVETVEYSSSVSWLKGRPAWVSDYAMQYSTSKHFIARSLNNSLDYFSQKVSLGSKFNVFKKDRKIEFHLLIDVSLCKMAFYYLDLDTHERILLKVYKVGLGRVDPLKPSGTLTPLGCYQLGDRVSIYTPGIMGFFHDQKTEMIRVFGSRWIPFGEEIEGCTEPSRGYGLHGAPWVVGSNGGDLVENRSCIGRYESDGCVRLLKEDMEEIYAIVITKPTFVHIAKNFQDITLPGVEVAAPSR